MFSQTVEYALRAMVYLAAQAPAARTAEQVAEATRVPHAYLAKVMRGLTRAGLVRSRRGLGGGAHLARAPGAINILEVVDAVDPIRRITTCPLGLAAHGVRLCPLHRRLDNALATVEKAFRQTNLADVVREPSPSVPLCPFPNVKTPGVKRR